MRWYVLLVALLQSLYCSGFPVYQTDLSSTADKALGLALGDVNTRLATTRLYRVTRGSVTRVIPMGMNIYDLMLSFGIKETDCLKSSGGDPQRCAFRPGFFVPTSTCFARVRMSAEAGQVVSLRCGKGDSSSSSSSSSEEMFARRRQNVPTFQHVPTYQNVPTFGNGDPTTPHLFGGEASPVLPGRAVPRQEVDTQLRGDNLQLRGDTFSNSLV